MGSKVSEGALLLIRDANMLLPVQVLCLELPHHPLTDPYIICIVFKITWICTSSYCSWHIPDKAQSVPSWTYPLKIEERGTWKPYALLIKTGSISLVLCRSSIYIASNLHFAFIISMTAEGLKEKNWEIGYHDKGLMKEKWCPYGPFRWCDKTLGLCSLQNNCRKVCLGKTILRTGKRLLACNIIWMGPPPVWIPK